MKHKKNWSNKLNKSTCGTWPYCQTNLFLSLARSLSICASDILEILDIFVVVANKALCQTTMAVNCSCCCYSLAYSKRRHILLCNSIVLSLSFSGLSEPIEWGAREEAEECVRINRRLTFHRASKIVRYCCSLLSNAYSFGHLESQRWNSYLFRCRIKLYFN